MKSHYPKVNRGHFLADPHEDISWAEGTLHDGRPFRIEYWIHPGTSLLTVFISTLDIENATPLELKDLLIRGGVIEFDDDKFFQSGFNGINLTAKKFHDISHNEMWSLTIILGDDDGTYIRTNVKFQKHTFPDKKTDPYIYTQKATNVENAEYFISLCEEQSKQGTSSMYHGYFINNSSVPIEIMFEMPHGVLSGIESGSTVNDLINGPIPKAITRYENIPAYGYTDIPMLYCKWEFDFSHARHLFLKTAGVEKHINFYMEKYYICREETDCIPVLNRKGWVCLPAFSDDNPKIGTHELKKGTKIKMRNGLEAIIVKKCVGNTLVAEVFGDFTETGNIYAHDIMAAMVEGQWVDVELTKEQIQFYEQFKNFYQAK